MRKTAVRYVAAEPRDSCEVWALLVAVARFGRRLVTCSFPAVRTLLTLSWVACVLSSLVADSGLCNPKCLLC